MTAATEVEIREAIADRMTYPASGDPTPEPGETKLTAVLRGIVEDYAQAITSAAFDVEAPVEDVLEAGQDPRDTDGLWADLRRSEAQRLRALADAAIARAVKSCETIIVDELTAAGVAFAAEHPDAPRPHGTQVAA